jgi:hypothetical protein
MRTNDSAQLASKFPAPKKFIASGSIPGGPATGGGFERLNWCLWLEKCSRRIDEWMSLIENEEERKAILRFMFGRSADLVERYLAAVLQAWGLRVENVENMK